MWFSRPGRRPGRTTADSIIMTIHHSIFYEGIFFRFAFVSFFCICCCFAFVAFLLFGTCLYFSALSLLLFIFFNNSKPVPWNFLRHVVEVAFVSCHGFSGDEALHPPRLPPSSATKSALHYFFRYAVPATKTESFECRPRCTADC